MYIGFAIGLFIVSYLIQLWLCLKAKNKHIKLIPLYLCVIGAIYSALLYVEFFGLYRTGSWMQLEAYIYFIILLIIGLALLLAKITHIIYRAAKTKKPINNEKDDSEYVYLCEKEAIYAGMLSDILEQNSIPFTTNNVLGAGITSKIGYAAEIVRFFVHKDYFEVAKELEESYLSGKGNV